MVERIDRITLSFQQSVPDIKMSVDYEGTLNLTFEVNKYVLKDLCNAIYEVMNTEDWLDTLDNDQMQEVIARFNKGIRNENI